MIALTAEIRALMRSGVPLENGLRWIAADMPGKLGRLAASLSDRLARGESLADAVNDPQLGMPRLYRAVIAAGIRSGNLTVALEGLATTAKRAAEVQRAIVVAMIYPLFLIVIASGLLTFTARKTAPIMVRTYENFQMAQPWWFEKINWFLESHPALALYGIAVAAIIIVSLVLSSRSRVLHSRRSWLFPTVGRMRRAGQAATFAEVLALLVEHQVPLDEGLMLAADASGDKHLPAATARLVEQLRRGGQARNMPAEIPRLIAWQITHGASDKLLASSLRRTADGYRRRALRMADWFSVYFPILAACVVGGSLTLLYGLVVIVPFYQLLFWMSLP